jgi:hypothetical protein
MNRVSFAIGVLALGLLGASVARAGAFKFSDTEAEAIIGEIQKPDVTVVISRENLNKAYDMQLSESFIERIVRAVETDPF